MAMISDYFAINCACSISPPSPSDAGERSFCFGSPIFCSHILIALTQCRSDGSWVFVLFGFGDKKQNKKTPQTQGHESSAFNCEVTLRLQTCLRCPLIKCFPIFFGVTFFFPLALFLHKPLMQPKRNGLAGQGEHEGFTKQ